ncbi:hypothetical protein SJAG_03201 [Schizosaccharomyces japonicus yFS275]|uniref:Uncharacterized protein n=1 Tax=Schizosaccharomyces japonicus (strain yFS275 / FY16936) TaxID=402676 RepID=B6K3L2_SCHJY|nr:hypothetical protein SJAG_03201 [Schizosaccharomyces japonicus yFS275]EEB08069.2 hypothetical protein SJAG_03201 [Schizosaccharomyces japonicus yFS275]
MVLFRVILGACLCMASFAFEMHSRNGEIVSGTFRLLERNVKNQTVLVTMKGPNTNSSDLLVSLERGNLISEKLLREFYELQSHSDDLLFENLVDELEDVQLLKPGEIINYSLSEVGLYAVHALRANKHDTRDFVIKVEPSNSEKIIPKKKSASFGSNSKCILIAVFYIALILVSEKEKAILQPAHFLSLACCCSDYFAVVFHTFIYHMGEMIHDEASGANFKFLVAKLLASFFRWTFLISFASQSGISKKNQITLWSTALLASTFFCVTSGASLLIPKSIYSVNTLTPLTKDILFTVKDLCMKALSIFTALFLYEHYIVHKDRLNSVKAKAYFRIFLLFVLSNALQGIFNFFSPIFDYDRDQWGYLVQLPTDTLNLVTFFKMQRGFFQRLRDGIDDDLPTETRFLDMKDKV